MSDPFFKIVLSLLFPKHCYSCRCYGHALCGTCLSTIPLAKPLEDRLSIALFDYSSPIVRRAIWELKYHGKSELARDLVDFGAPLISEFIAENMQTSQNNVIFVPIPQYRTKRRIKGFNQSAVLAAWLTHAIPHSTVWSVLEKTKATIPQAKIQQRILRLQNVAHTMQATKPLTPHNLYIIVDDVITTGATIAEAKRALIAQGARKIYAIGLAHGYAKHT